ncbi:hypothetical protein Kpol_1050p83 [Vanderwaltozyma polyspora DSM 70294]|uniref:Uncharacterized protein n=1 Tax=Vanderwaltozyma polyspora (strain ATCC 22028 / DSM 70294 / BCRC 21397 / CBS 2163 / NBRC 10782 / NRRL Y-8283 / UCD 57-17) TaxID=436907 RepID=A7TEX7_VANPO|nr:uncharacterized protein Kpol_1050p83 [Vanderwaltozyma polyspora DSM 70294]EDO19223.1 hypothetical protein Kpol_1050p83 [Vanderwaltozyma polyspora DSM 70294]
MEGSRDLGEDYFESLCSQEQYLESNYEDLVEVLEGLEGLLDDGCSEERQLELIRGLASGCGKLNGSLIDLKFGKYNTREAQVKMQKGNNDQKLVNEVSQYQDYFALVETVNQDMLVYINLLERLASDLFIQVEDAQFKDNEVIMVDEVAAPVEVQDVLKKYITESSETSVLRDELDKYLNEIKMERAELTIKNKFSLQPTLNELSKEVNYWRKEWDNMEMLMFGDGPNSMKRMMKNIESLRAKALTSIKEQN